MITTGGLKVLLLTFSLCLAALAAVLGGAVLADGLGDPTAARVLRYLALALALVGGLAAGLLLICLGIRAVEDDEAPIHACHDHEPDEPSA